MSSRRSRRKRSKGLVFLLMPALIFIGFIGWCMYVLDQHGRRQKIQPQRSRRTKDTVTLMPIFEDQQHVEADISRQ